MPTFVQNPNLPENPVQTVLISARAPKCVFRRLESLGIETIPVPDCEELGKPVSAHPDMQIHHLGGKKIVCQQNLGLSLRRRFIDLGFELIKCESTLKPAYPFDIALNAARVGRTLLCRPDFTDRIVTDACGKNQIHIQSVRQGYAKCSVCVVDGSSIITADKGIERAAKLCGIEVLLIQPGFIRLPGYGTGFFGGCCGKLAADHMFFCGDLSSHPDCGKIRAFLSERGIEAESIAHEPLSDIGSIIPLIENA
jgi:hypothetical protein